MRQGRSLGVLWSSYFDDFPTVSHSMHVSSTMACAKGMLSLFGFAYAEEKSLPFRDSAEVLGVVLDLAETKGGVVKIENKPSRVHDLGKSIDDIVRGGKAVPRCMPSVLGKLQYADCQVWGRAGRIALADLRDFGHTSSEAVNLDGLQVRAFEILKERLCRGKPRLFVADDVEKPFLIFTDGALEYVDGKASATMGAVFIPPSGRTEVFGCKVPDEILAGWQVDGKTHVIGLVELYACVVAYLFWKPLISSSRLILFVDNWPALDALVKGTSSQHAWRQLLLLLEDPCEDYFMLWVARVPSKSNVADYPSRGSVEELKFLKPFEVVTPKCPVLHSPLDAII